MRWAFLLILYALVPVLLYYTLDPLLVRCYIFDPVKLQELSQVAIKKHAGNMTALTKHLVDGLREEYGEQYVNAMDEDSWFFNNAGGAMGALFILHASLTEYLILFGTPLGTEGHSGVHMADDYFTILSGEQTRFKPGEFEAVTFTPGMQNHLRRGESIQYAMKGWALELAQGWIPTMLPFGYLDTFTSTLDFANLWKTTWLTAKNMVGQLLIRKV